MTNCFICNKPTPYATGPDGPQPSHPKCRELVGKTENGLKTTGTLIATKPEWGEKIQLGKLFMMDSFVRRPLNQVAFNRMQPVEIVALLLVEKIQKLEEEVEELKGKVSHATRNKRMI